MNRMVIGLGNPFRRDDAAGLEAARRIRHTEWHVLPVGGLELLDLWDGADEVVVIDAMRSGRPPGSVCVFDGFTELLDMTEGFGSTHGLGLLSAIGLGRELGRLPQRLVVYGIEAADVAPGVELSPAVVSAVERVVAEVDHA